MALILVVLANDADGRHARRMCKSLLVAVALLPAAVGAQTVPSVVWEVRSTIVSLDVPGVPAFLRRMAKGHMSAERKCLPPNPPIAALLAPDPKAHCRIDEAEMASGRYLQTLTCPQKQGRPMRVVRSGAYSADGFSGRAVVTGTTGKGPTTITLDQRASRSGGSCSG